jgi:hypothetical protein
MGKAPTKIELTLPPDGWLGKLLSPTLGKIITVDDVEIVPLAVTRSMTAVIRVRMDKGEVACSHLALPGKCGVVPDPWFDAANDHDRRQRR